VLLRAFGLCAPLTTLKPAPLGIALSRCASLLYNARYSVRAGDPARRATLPYGDAADSS